MEIILTQDVERLGSKDDVVVVKDGYARNFLILRQNTCSDYNLFRTRGIGNHRF